jgi:hypothetical protein
MQEGRPPGAEFPQQLENRAQPPEAARLERIVPALVDFDAGITQPRLQGTALEQAKQLDVVPLCALHSSQGNEHGFRASYLEGIDNVRNSQPLRHRFRQNSIPGLLGSFGMHGSSFQPGPVLLRDRGAEWSGGAGGRLHLV